MSKVDSVRPVVSPVSSIKHDNKCAAIPDAHRVRIGGLGSLMVGIHGRGAPIRMSSALQRTSKVKIVPQFFGRFMIIPYLCNQVSPIRR